MKRLLLISAALVLMNACPGFAQQITIDGSMFDWEPATQLDVPPNAIETTFSLGDDTDPVRGSTDANYFADLDIEDVFGTSDNDFVYLRIKMNSIANIENVATDTSYHGGGALTAYISVDPGAGDTTGLTWGWWGSGYDYFVQVFPADTAFEHKTGYQQALYEHNQSGTGWDYSVRDTNVGVKVAWNAANNDVEMAIPKSLLLNPLHLPKSVVKDTIAIMIYGGENLGPWRADYASNPGISGYKLKVGGLSAIKDTKSPGAKHYTLLQNYPNPFNPSTSIKYTLPESGNVKVKVFNLMGQEIKTLVNEYHTAGTYTVKMDAVNIPSGVYLYTIEANQFRETRKMTVLK